MIFTPILALVGLLARGEDSKTGNGSNDVLGPAVLAAGADGLCAHAHRWGGLLSLG